MFLNSNLPLFSSVFFFPTGNGHFITVSNIPHQAAQSSSQVATATITIPNASTLVHNQVHTTASVDNAVPITTQVAHQTVNTSAVSQPFSLSINFYVLLCQQQNVQQAVYI